MIIKPSEIKPFTPQKLKTGLDFFDSALSGGFPLNTVMLLSGQKGSGKSTLASQIMSAFIGQDKKVLYLAGEEDPGAILARFNRVSSVVPNDSNLVFWQKDLLNGQADKFIPIDKVLIYCENTGIDLLVIDSKQKIGISGTKKQKLARNTEAIEYLYNYTQLKRNLTSLIVSQSIKNGSAAGSNADDHEVDIVAKLVRFPDSETMRSFIVEKNRQGRESTGTKAVMTERGLTDFNSYDATSTSETIQTPVKNRFKLSLWFIIVLSALALRIIFLVIQRIV